MRKRHNHIIEQVPVDYYQKGVKENFFQRLWHTNKLGEVLDEIKRYPRRVLDVGCASGWFISEISRQYPKAKYHGIDIYDRGIAHAKKKYSGIEFNVAGAHEIPYRNNFFDLVICTEVLEHLEEPKAALLEIKRVLKKNGIAIIELDSGSLLFSIIWFFWNNTRGNVWKEAHLHSFNSRKLEEVSLECGFKVLNKKKFNLGMAMVFTLQKR